MEVRVEGRLVVDANVMFELRGDPAAPLPSSGDARLWTTEHDMADYTRVSVQTLGLAEDRRREGASVSPARMLDCIGVQGAGRDARLRPATDAQSGYPTFDQVPQL